MLAGLKGNAFIRHLVKILVLLAAASVLIYMGPASDAVLAERTGAEITADFQLYSLAVSGFGLLVLAVHGDIKAGSTLPEVLLFAAGVIIGITVIKCAVVFYCSLGEKKQYHNRDSVYGYGLLTRLCLRILGVVGGLLAFPFTFVLTALRKLTATYTDSFGRELPVREQNEIAISSALTYLAILAAYASGLAWPIAIVLVIVFAVFIRYSLPYELSSFIAYEMNLTDRSIATKSLLLDTLAIVVYVLYVQVLNNDITRRQLFTGPGIEDTFPLYLLFVLPFILLLYLSAMFSITIKEKIEYRNENRPILAFIQNNTGLVFMAVFMIALRLLSIYSVWKGALPPVERVGEHSKVLLIAILARIHWFIVMTLLDIARYGKLPGSPEFFRLFSYDAVFVPLLIIRALFYGWLAVKLIKALLSYIKQALAARFPANRNRR